MADGLAGTSGWGVGVWSAALGWVFGVAFKGSADEVAGAEADGEGEGEDDAAEEDAKGQGNHVAAHLEVVEDHGGGEDEDQPLNARERKRAYCSCSLTRR